MFENLSVFENRYEELNMKLYDPAVAADRNLYRDLMKEDAEAILNASEADKELRQWRATR